MNDANIARTIKRQLETVRVLIIVSAVAIVASSLLSPFIFGLYVEHRVKSAAAEISANAERAARQIQNELTK